MIKNHIIININNYEDTFLTRRPLIFSHRNKRNNNKNQAPLLSAEILINPGIIGKRYQNTSSSLLVSWAVVVGMEWTKLLWDDESKLLPLPK